jgi:hypothetical protein
VPLHGYPTSERIRMAADNFASRDLLTTVTAEATGILRDELGDRLPEILSSLPAANHLLPQDFVEAVERAGVGVELTAELCEFLFLAGLLGNYDPRTNYIQFYHRRDTYKFRHEGPWRLHMGLMYAFNIPFSRGTQLEGA